MPINAIPFFPPTVTLKSDDSLLDALKLMLANQINHAPICDGEGVFIGLISTNAILRALIPASATTEGGLSSLKFAGDGLRLLASHLHNLGRIKVAEFASTDMHVLREDSPILEAAQQLAKSAAPLPMVNKEGKLLGLISRRALLAYLIAQQGN